MEGTNVCHVKLSESQSRFLPTLLRRKTVHPTNGITSANTLPRTLGAHIWLGPCLVPSNLHAKDITLIGTSHISVITPGGFGLSSKYKPLLKGANYVANTKKLGYLRMSNSSWVT